MGELPSTTELVASQNFFHPSITIHLMMEEPESIGMQKMEPIYSPLGSNNHADNPPGYNQYPPTPAPSSPPTANPSPPPGASPEPSDRPPSRPPFSITLIGLFLVMAFGYFFISYVVIPGWKEVVKEAEKIEAKVRGTAASEPQFDQSLVQVPMSLLHLKEERNELNMTPTETAEEVYHVTNRIVVPQLTGTGTAAVPSSTGGGAGGFVVGEDMEDTSKDTTTTTACTATASGNDGDKKKVNNNNEREDHLNNNNDKSVLRSRRVAPRRVTIKEDTPPSELSPSGHDHELNRPRRNTTTNSSWGHDFHNKLKEVATHDQVVEVGTKTTMSIDETLNTDKLPLVLLPPGGGGGGVEDATNKRDQKLAAAHHDHPVPATNNKSKSKSKPESSEPQQSQQSKQSKPELLSAEKKNNETEKKPDDKKDNKRDWINPPPHNPKPTKVGADPTPREPKTVNLGENYGTEGLHKVQGTVHLPDGRTYYPYGDHYKPRRSVYGWPTQSTQSRAWETMYPHEGDGHYGGGVARRASGAVMPTTTTAASHQYIGYGAGAAPESSSTQHAALASTSRPETQQHQGGYAPPAKDTRGGASNSASASSAYATSTPAVLRRVESFAEKYDVESSHHAAAAAPHHQYWYSPYQRPDGGKLDVPMHHLNKPDVVPTGIHENNNVKQRHEMRDEGGEKGKEDNNGKGHIPLGKDKSGEGGSSKLANKGKGKFLAGKGGSFHSRRRSSPGPAASPAVGVTHLDWANNDVEYGNGLIPRSGNGGVDCDQITEDTDCSNNAADGSADGSASGSGHSARRSEPEGGPEVHHGDGGDSDGNKATSTTPLHPNPPKGKSWNHWFRGRVGGGGGGGGVDHSRNKGGEREREKEKQQETETYKESQKKVMVKAMKCGIEITVSKASASGSSVTATASFTVKASPKPNKWWTPHPHLTRTDVSRSSSSATNPTSTPTVATSKPTTTSSSESNGPSHVNKNERGGKRAVVTNNAYNDDHPHRGMLEIHLSPEEAKPELMDAKYDYWEFKSPPDIYMVSDQDSPFNPYAGAREKKKKEAEEAERKRKEQEEQHDKTYWQSFKKRPDATDVVGCKEPDSLGRVWGLGGYGDVGEYSDERGVK